MEYLANILGTGSVAGLIGGLTLWVLSKYFGSYWSKKGENLATKQDIYTITQAVESAKKPFADALQQLTAQNQQLLEESKAKHQMRFAALDTRLRAHQEAYALWNELSNSMHSDKVRAQVQECMNWFWANCLYLEPAVREAYLECVSAASMHSYFLSARSEAEAKENWKKVQNFDAVVSKAVLLTPISFDALDQIKNFTEPGRSETSSKA